MVSNLKIHEIYQVLKIYGFSGSGFSCQNQEIDIILVLFYCQVTTIIRKIHITGIK